MIAVVTGVSGSGKSTIGAMLAAQLGWAFADGDSFHSAANIATMLAGVPLTDADRLPWLAAITAWIDDQIAAGKSAVVACSALKRAYRQELVHGQPQIRLVFLQISHDSVVKRLIARHGHFFPRQLLDSQFAALESPEPAEGVLVVSAEAEPAEIIAEIVRGLDLPG